jgi:hypothetical protein
MIRKTSLGFCVFTLLMSATVQAYIPYSRTILGRLARNDGKGLYAIEQELQFRTEGEPLILRERWIVENGSSMRVTISSPVNGKSAADSVVGKVEYLYKNGQRYRIEQGQVRSGGENPEFIEPYLHFRSARAILEAMSRDKIVPSSFLRDRSHAINLANMKYGSEPFVRLGRSGGMVTYIFGEPSPTNGEKLSPELWVDQDSFLFRRLRLPSQAEVSADKHSTYPGGLKLPRERTVTWENNSVVIRVLSVKGLPESSKGLLLPNSLTAGAHSAAHLPEQAQVKDFYARFR